MRKILNFREKKVTNWRNRKFAMSERRSNSNKVIVQLDPDNSFSQDSPPDSMVIYQIVFSSQRFLKTFFYLLQM